MLDLQMTHPKFDLAVEILASIPPYPHYVRLRDLREDFGFDSHADCVEALGKLKNNYGVIAMNCGKLDGRGLAISRERWLDAQKLGADYLRLVNSPPGDAEKE